MTYCNSDLAKVFPAALRDDAVVLSRAFPVPRATTHTFSAFVGDELVQIPYRIYHDPETMDPTRFTDSQIELLDCLLTRHHSGFVREKYDKDSSSQ